MVDLGRFQITVVQLGHRLACGTSASPCHPAAVRGAVCGAYRWQGKAVALENRTTERQVTMFERERAWASQFKVGQKVRIRSMSENARCDYQDGREGVIEHIDDAGQLHGSWGGVALTMDDSLEIV